MPNRKKPTVQEIIELKEKNIKIYSPLRLLQEEEELFYNLNFKDRLNIPEEFKNDRVVLPTARDVVDVAVNHTDVNNAKILVNKKGTSDIADESAEMLRKLGLGIIHCTNVESRIAPGHVGAKHYWIHGLAVFKTVWDADRWIDKPPQNKGEADDMYAKRLDEWRAETHQSFPIVIQAVNPSNVMPDPHTGGDLYVMEYHRRSPFDAKLMWPRWTNPLGKGEDDEVEYVSYWDGIYRSEIIDDEPIFKVGGGVFKHNYGFNPYTLIETGLGNLARNAAPEDRYVGLLRHIFDLLISESTNYTLNDILVKWETLLGGYITGADAGTVSQIKQEYGKWWPVGDKDVKFVKWERNMPPAEAFQHLALTHDYISGHAAPRSVRGLSETGVRSGADRRLVLAEAAAIYRYASPAFARGWSDILNKCAMLIKNVIPGDVEVWTRTPTDEFDVPIKKNLLREPFNITVEFAPISEEDEYRRHDDLERQVQTGLITRKTARKRMANVDPKEEELEEERQKLKDSEILNQMIQQYAAGKLGQAIQQKEGADAIQLGVVPGTPTQSAPQEEVRGDLTTGVPDRAPLGSAQDLQNQLAKLRSQSPISPGQGIGGGGSRA